MPRNMYIPFCEMGRGPKDGLADFEFAVSLITVLINRLNPPNMITIYKSKIRCLNCGSELLQFPG